jgi:hypothetical protein
MAIRLPDPLGTGEDQDLLLVTSVDAPIAHHVFLPAGDVQQRPYSSSLPFRDGAGGQFLVGALPDPTSPRPGGDHELDRLDRAAATGRLRFRIAVAPVFGRFRAVAELHVGERLGPELDALRFNPFNAGGGIAPTGVLNRLRDYAYPLSQAAWRLTRGAGEAQDRADDLAEPLAAQVTA